jgi:nitrite reductase/ring-hydroxylating ferredoxin subunit
MEMDYQEGPFFDDSGRWLLCSTHGAAYEPDSGACAGGPRRGGLVKIALSESDGVHWHGILPQLKPLSLR